MEFMDSYDGLFNLILTSPPYNMTKRKGGDADTGRYDIFKDWKEPADYIDWTGEVFNKFDKVLINNGVVLYNFSYSIENPSLPYKLISHIIDDTNFCIADTIIWKKKHSIPFPASPNRLQRICEFVFVLVRKDEIKTFTTNKKITKISDRGQRYYSPVANFIVAKNNDGETKEINQATFSTDLVTQLLHIYAKKDKAFKVFDPFIGTGTTAVACLKYGCSVVGTEISASQCEYSEDRIADMYFFDTWGCDGK